MATLRMEVWATLANTALRSSLNREDPNLAAPSAGVYTYTIHVTFACTYMHVHKYEHYKEINMLVCTCAVYVYTVHVHGTYTQVAKQCPQ